MENGIVVSRAKFTRLRETFTLSWDSLPIQDYAQLRNFYKTVLGGSVIFLWTYPKVENDPLSENQFQMRFSSEEPSFELFSPGFYKGSITLEEA